LYSLKTVCYYLNEKLRKKEKKKRINKD